MRTVKQQVLGTLRRLRLLSEHRRGILRYDIGNGMGAALVADQKRIAIGEIARAGRAAMCRYQSAIGVVGMTGSDALGDDPARGVLAEMQHLGAGIDLLIAVRDGDRIELAARI